MKKAVDINQQDPDEFLEQVRAATKPIGDIPSISAAEIAAASDIIIKTFPSTQYTDQYYGKAYYSASFNTLKIFLSFKPGFCPSPSFFNNLKNVLFNNKFIEDREDVIHVALNESLINSLQANSKLPLEKQDNVLVEITMNKQFFEAILVNRSKEIDLGNLRQATNAPEPPADLPENPTAEQRAKHDQENEAYIKSVAEYYENSAGNAAQGMLIIQGTFDHVAYEHYYAPDGKTVLGVRTILRLVR